MSKKQLAFQVGIVSRGKGTCRSAVDAGAYILGEKWKSEYDKNTYDHSDKSEEVIYTALLVPPNTHELLLNPYTLVHAIEWSEPKKNSQLMRSIYFPLPPEFCRRQQIDVLTEFVNRAFVSKGMAALCAIHHTEGNPNAHILLTMRQMLPDGSFLPKSKDFAVVDEQGQPVLGKTGKPKTQKVCLHDWDFRGNVDIWRQMCAEDINRHYQLAGLDIQVDHRSPKRQGLPFLSPVYMSQKEYEAEKRGERTEAGDLNRWLKEENGRRANYETRKEAIDQLVLEFTKKYKQLGRKESYKSPRTRATQEFWNNLRAIEAQFGKEGVTPPSEPISPAQTPYGERGAEKGMS